MIYLSRATAKTETNYMSKAAKTGVTIKRSGMFICTVVSCIDDGAASNAAPLR